MALSIVYCLLLLFAVSSADNKPILRIGALLPLTESKESPLEAIWSVPRAGDVCQLAVDHVNNYTGLLPNYTLQLVTNDTKCDFGLANYVMFQHVMAPAGERPIVLIGEGCFLITDPLVNTGKLWNVPQFNFLSSYPTRSSSETYYPLIPPLEQMIRAVAELMKVLEWKQSAILHQAGELFTDVSNLFAESFDKNDLLFSHDKFQVTSHDMATLINKIKNSKKRIMFGFFFENVARRVVCEAFLEGIKAPDYVWILPGWYNPNWYRRPVGSESKQNCSVSDMEEALNGHFTVDYIQLRSDLTMMTAVEKTVEDIAKEWRSKSKDTKGEDIQLKRVFSLYEAYGYDAVLSIAQMLQGVLRENPQANLSQLNYLELANLTKNMTSVPFEGLTGTIEVGAERSTDIEIQYVQSDISNVTFRYYSENKTLQLVSQPQWTTADGQKPLDSPRNESDYEEQGFFIVTSAFASIGVVFAIIMLTFNEYHRDKRVIKLSSPRLNNLIGIGAVAIYLAVIMSGLDGDFFPMNSQALACCYIHVIFLTMGFTLTFGSMFAKTWRVNVIMKRSRTGQRNIKLTDHILFAIVGVLLLVDAILLALWFGLDPYEEEISFVESTFKVQYLRDHCSSENSARWTYILVAYKSLLLAFGVFMAWETRKVKMVSLNDSRYITMSVYNTVFMCIVTFAFNFIPDEGTAHMLVAFSIIVMVTVVLCLVFIPKMYTLMVKGDQAVEQSGRVANAERRKSEHTIAKKSDIRELHRQNKHQKQIIRMLLEQRNLSPEIIEQVQLELHLGSTSGTMNSDAASTDAVETETKTNNELTFPGTSTEIHETQT